MKITNGMTTIAVVAAILNFIFHFFFRFFLLSRLHLFVSKRLFSMSRTMALHRMILMWVAFCTVDILNGSDSDHDDDDGNYDSSDTNWNVPNELNPQHTTCPTTHFLCGFVGSPREIPNEIIKFYRNERRCIQVRNDQCFVRIKFKIRMQACVSVDDTVRCRKKSKTKFSKHL